MTQDSHKLYMEFHYPVGDPGSFKVYGNIKPEHHADMIVEFLLGQMSRGKDERPANERDLYVIRLKIDLSDDSWAAESNCGNMGLRDGILMDILGRLERAQV